MKNNEIFILLQKLSIKKQTLFAICCTERIISLYKFFEEEISNETNSYFNNFKNGYKDLHNLVEIVYNVLISKKNYCDVDYKKYEKQCLKLAPDTEEVSSGYSILAQNSAISLAYVFRFIVDKKLQSIICCSNKIIECIDIIEYLNKTKDSKLKDIINNEKKNQLNYIETIESLTETFSDQELKIIRELNQKNSIKM